MPFELIADWRTGELAASVQGSLDAVDIEGIEASGAAWIWLQTHRSSISGISLLDGISRPIGMHLHGTYSFNFGRLPLTGNINRLKLSGELSGSVDLGTCAGLEELTLNGNASSKMLIEGLGDANLTKLQVWRLRRDQVLSISKLKHLKNLSLTFGQFEDLSFLNNSTCIEGLHLEHVPKLRNIDAVRCLPVLEVLAIHNAKRIDHDYSCLSDARSLNAISFFDCADIETITVCKDIEGLEFLSIMGDTRILDGDIAVLRSMPKLAYALLPQKKNYNMSVECLPKSEAVDMRVERRLQELIG